MKAVLQRYAGALADVAIEQGTAEKVKAELVEFTGLVNSSTDLRNFLANPSVARGQKQGVVEKLVGRMDASRTVRNFLFVLVENRRVALLPQICAAFEDELQARLGVTRVEVTSAGELTAQERSDLTRALEQLTGRKVEVRYEQNPELIAGAQVRIGSTIYDGSVRKHLNRLRERLAAE